jgi:cation/acetate symporter
VVGAVITLNVALGGMKGITLVQAVQYWIKMFAISVPIFVLLSVYGGYGKNLSLNKSALDISSAACHHADGEFRRKPERLALPS